MAEWNSNPSVPHTGGTFNLPEKAKLVEYTISYTDDYGCTASTTYTVTPSCELYNFDTFGDEEEVDATGGTLCCTTSSANADALTVSSKPDWTHVTSGIYNDNITYNIECDANNTDNERTGRVTFTSIDGYCTFETGSIIQAAIEPEHTKLATYFPMEPSENSCLQNLFPDGTVNVEVTLNINGELITKSFRLTSPDTDAKIDLGRDFTYSNNVIIESMTINGKLKLLK